jgi:predicted metal-dependent phosphoesterase TrpH
MARNAALPAGRIVPLETGERRAGHAHHYLRFSVESRTRRNFRTAHDMIDLHTHTDKSDGASTPLDLVRAAAEAGIDTLGISDHDTFAGYDEAVPLAREAGIELVCGIELSTRLPSHSGSRGRSVHMLGYFLAGEPTPEFRAWLETNQRSRRERNRKLIARLNSLGIEITLGEVEALGRTLAGRPHFARILVEKGYAANRQEAFDRYIGEEGRAYVCRDEPSIAEGIRRIREAGGLPSLAHPIRIGAKAEAMLPQFVDAGLLAIEAYHSDHRPEDVRHYLALAQRYGLLVTGGTDFHGDNKPGVALGSVELPRPLWERLRSPANVARRTAGD